MTHVTFLYVILAKARLMAKPDFKEGKFDIGKTMQSIGNL